jgi:hypothetical protein
VHFPADRHGKRDHRYFVAKRAAAKLSPVDRFQSAAVFRSPRLMGVNAEAGAIGEFEDLRTHGRPLTTSFCRLVETFQIERLLAVAHDAPIGRGASQQVRARR